MKVNKPTDREILIVEDLRIGDLFTFATHMVEREPGVYLRTQNGYVVVRAVSALGACKGGSKCTGSMDSEVYRVQIDEITVLE